MIIAVSVAALVAALLFVLFIRSSDLPFVEPTSPTVHLDERKAAIYENIRDANFEFLMGKLSDHDYQQTKADLQAELAVVNAEIEAVMKSVGAPKIAASPRQKREARPAQGKASATESKATSQNAPVGVATAPVLCPHCGAGFEQEMKFCGECGKSMTEVGA